MKQPEVIQKLNEMMRNVALATWAAGFVAGQERPFEILTDEQLNAEAVSFFDKAMIEVLLNRLSKSDLE